MENKSQTTMKTMFKQWTVLCTGGLVLLVSLMLASCGGGGTVPWPGVEIRPLDTEFTSRMAVAYSPYRTSTSDAGFSAELASMTAGQIRQDLDKLQQAGFGMVRVFDAKVAAKTVEAIRLKPELDMKMMLGVWISTNTEENNAEIARAVTLARNNADLIKAISVGNETLVSWNYSYSQTSKAMAAYLRTVRTQVNQPVTTDDNWAFFAAQRYEKDPHPIFNEIDFISLHTYPFIDIKYGLWDWKQESTPAGPQRVVAMMDAALQKAKADYQAVRNHLDQYGYGRLPIIVGETGWKAVATNGEGLWASPVNQRMYFDRLRAWKQESNGPKTVVYFAAFDERWKSGDNGWGLFESGWNSNYTAFDANNRLPRCTVLALNSSPSAGSGSCADAQARYYTPPVSQGVVSTARYTVYADETHPNETRASGIAMGPWTGGAGAAVSGQTSGDGTQAWQVTPSPVEWGWGLAWTLNGQEINLSQFANGYLNFKIKTTYPGKIEVGFKTGADAEFNAWDVFLVLSPGMYGYDNGGKDWSTVSIPIADLVKNGGSSYGSNAPPALLQMGRVSNVFVLADRYEKTGKAKWANHTTPILIDDIHWSR